MSEAYRRRVGGVSEEHRRKVGGVSEAYRRRVGGVSEEYRRIVGGGSEAGRGGSGPALGIELVEEEERAEPTLHYLCMWCVCVCVCVRAFAPLSLPVLIRT